MNGWILDIIFFALLFLGILFGARRGLIKCVCKLAGTLFSIAFAFIFCISFSNALEGWFGMETALAGSVGTTFASILSIVISFLALVVIIRLGAWLIGKIGTALVEKFGPLGVLNRVLGGLFGLFEAALLIFFLLAVCCWINVGAVNAYIDSSYVVSAIYHWDWFIQAAHLKIWK